ncbi:MAG TPA: RnfH family protein [Burkholderiales bacterium]|jgi:hypothetical protein
MAETLRVVYVPTGAAPVEIEVPLAAGMTLEDAVRASGIAARHPEIEAARLGVWGKARDAQSPARAGDRVEIYRPLTADPKAGRNQRVRKKREAKAAAAK